MKPLLKVRDRCGLKWTSPVFRGELRANSGMLHFVIDRPFGEARLYVYSTPRYRHKRTFQFKTVQEAANAACRIVNRARARGPAPKQQTLFGARR